MEITFKIPASDSENIMQDVALAKGFNPNNTSEEQAVLLSRDLTTNMIALARLGKKIRIANQEKKEVSDLAAKIEVIVTA